MLRFLTDSNMNEIEGRIARAGRDRDTLVTLYTHEARALYDLARRAPLPAVDRHLDELAAGLIAAKEGT